METTEAADSRGKAAGKGLPWSGSLLLGRACLLANGRGQFCHSVPSGLLCGATLSSRRAVPLTSPTRGCAKSTRWCFTCVHASPCAIQPRCSCQEGQIHYTLYRWGNEGRGRKAMKGKSLQPGAICN